MLISGNETILQLRIRFFGGCGLILLGLSVALCGFKWVGDQVPKWNDLLATETPRQLVIGETAFIVWLGEHAVAIAAILFFAAQILRLGERLMAGVSRNDDEQTRSPIEEALDKLVQIFKK